MCGCIRADSNNSLHSEASHIEDVCGCITADNNSPHSTSGASHMCAVVGSGRSFSPHSRPALN